MNLPMYELNEAKIVNGKQTIFRTLYYYGDKAVLQELHYLRGLFEREKISSKTYRDFNETGSSRFFFSSKDTTWAVEVTKR
jgi:hypothetical protein